MTKALSLYLDVLRFGAAFTVFLAHYSVQRISGGFFWPSFAYGHTAVLVFFVLSGFVIAWVTETRERGLEDYVLSRAARLYSVIIPAFIITAAVNSLRGGGRRSAALCRGAERRHAASSPELCSLRGVFRAKLDFGFASRVKRSLLVA